MKTRLLFLLLTIVGASTVQAQICTPVHDFGDESYGVYPDTIQNLAHAMVNELYFQQMDVKIPANGDDLGIPFTIDSAQIVSVSGLPAGINWACGDPDCTYDGGVIGCGVISGTPTVVDTFDIVINTTFYGSIFGSSMNMPMQFTGYKLIVEGEVGIEQAAAAEFQLHPVQPNPAANRAKIAYVAPNGGKVSLVIYDLLGKQVLEKFLDAAPGENEFVLRTDGLQSGLYICTLSLNGESLSRKLTIKR